MCADTMRLKTGVPGLDEALGGGLLPGALTIFVGATGIGKTQAGLHFLNAGLEQEGRRGVVIDMLARGDDQNHAPYARRLFGWEMQEWRPDVLPGPATVFELAEAPGDYLAAFETHGRRVTRHDLDESAWREWNMEFQRRLGRVLYFVYGALIHGARRVVFDGIEPADRQSESIQLELFEYIYHQILRKESDWVARDLLRAEFRANAERVDGAAYDYRTIGALYLQTDKETMLEPMIERPIEEGDLLANANTVILMGKFREGRRLRRALYVAKHRGSACSDEILPFEITDKGIEVIP